MCGLVTHKGLGASLASNTQRVKNVRGLVAHNGLRVWAGCTQRVKSVPAGHTQSVKRLVGWSHTKGE